MRGLRSGLNRHLTRPPHKKNFCLMSDPAFHNSNQMFDAVIKQMKGMGKDESKHYPHISENDLKSLQSPGAFNLNSPKELQEKVFFDIQLNFGRRGGENLRSLKKDTFIFAKDDSDLEYVEFRHHEKTKNHPNFNPNQARPRLYELKNEICPIKSLKLYLSKLSDESDDFFCQPKLNVDTEKDVHWYTKRPIGVSKLGKFMKGISIRLNLSVKYTNHSIRATTVHVLSARGIPSRQIMRTTNHKCESSLKSYDTENTIGQKRAISNILSNYSSTKISSTATSTSTLSRISPNNNDEVSTTQSTTTCTTTSSMETIEKVASEGLDLPNNNRSIVLSGNFTNCTFKF